MRPGAASASSIEHWSGSDFMSQWFMEEWSPPLVPVGPASEPCSIRVVAYRPHQVHPARPEARDDHNSGNWRRGLGKLSVRKIWARSNTAGDKRSVRLKQLVLLGDRRIQLCLEQGKPALRLPDIEATAQLHGQKFMRDVER